MYVNVWGSQKQDNDLIFNKLLDESEIVENFSDNGIIKAFSELAKKGTSVHDVLLIVKRAALWFDEYIEAKFNKIFEEKWRYKEEHLVKTLSNQFLTINTGYILSFSAIMFGLIANIGSFVVIGIISIILTIIHHVEAYARNS